MHPKFMEFWKQLMIQSALKIHLQVHNESCIAQASKVQGQALWRFAWHSTINQKDSPLFPVLQEYTQLLSCCQTIVSWKSMALQFQVIYHQETGVEQQQLSTQVLARGTSWSISRQDIQHLFSLVQWLPLSIPAGEGNISTAYTRGHIATKSTWETQQFDGEHPWWGSKAHKGAILCSSKERSASMPGTSHFW